MSFLSLESGLLFVHLYKNAGSSIEAALSQRFVSDLTLRPPSVTKSAFVNQLIHRHLLLRSGHVAMSIRARGLKRLAVLEALNKHLPVTTFEENIDLKGVYSFAVVRNPWSWQVSIYNYARSTPSHYQYGQSQYRDFDAYIRWRCSSEVRLQSRFLSTHSGVAGLSRTLRYENLQEEWAGLRSLQNWALPDLPHVNRSTYDDYRAYYNDHTAELVASTFRADVVEYGYTFDA
jgi:hypothetical protein